MKSSSNNRVTGIITSFLLLAVIAVAIVISYGPIFRNAEKLIMDKEQNKAEEASERQKDEFVKEILKGNYCLYWDAVNERLDSYNLASKVFLKQGGIHPEFNNVLEIWHERFFTQVLQEYDLNYYILDHSTRKSITNTNEMLSSLLVDSEKSDVLRESLSFYIVFHYGENGNLEITQFSGLGDKYISEFFSMEQDRAQFLEEPGLYDLNGDQIEYPTNVTIIYGSHKKDLFEIEGGYLHDYYYRVAFDNEGFRYVYWIAVISVILLGLLLPLKKSWMIGEKIVTKIPFEVISAAIYFNIVIPIDLEYLAMNTARGTLFNTEFSVLPRWMSQILIYVINFNVWMIILSLWFIAIVSYRQIFTMGIKRYLLERTIIYKISSVILKNVIKIVSNLMKKIKIFYHSLKKIDLTDSTNKDIIKILVANFVILSILCSLWFLGIVGLIVYSIALFFAMKGFMKQTKKNYTVLVELTSKVAQGNLEISMEEELGIFEPLKQELSKIRFGFKKAVEEEMKSQKMKSELITNVSHDLKTPLTAIITYINLLKEKDLSEEEIESYLDTIDKKSQRLKLLIEDLFEISKASSNNVVLNIVELDLTNLIKQVRLEMDDKIRRTDVDFRMNLPEEKVMLQLDSDKTYRIFENLITNITKYAMPHTRAYIDMSMNEDSVTVILKNVSAEELIFQPDDITERFVRGDKSRNTEGSGLGLAIVKSFVELQKGTFQIVLDGDLFKTVIEWKR